MANYMTEVAKMFGVEINKEFKCNENSYTYVITKYGMKCNGCHSSESLGMFLNGALTVKQKPNKPSVDEKFYVVLNDGSVMLKFWEDCANHLNYYRIGNCYKTKEEAENNRNKWTAFYLSDEVLEV